MIVPRMLHELELCQMNQNHMSSDVYEQYIAQKYKQVARTNTTWPKSQNGNEQHKVNAIHNRRQSNATRSHQHDDCEVAKEVGNHGYILEQPPMFSRPSSISSIGTSQCCRSCCIISTRTLLMQQNSTADEDEQSNDKHSDVGQHNSNCIQWIVNTNSATNTVIKMSVNLNQLWLTITNFNANILSSRPGLILRPFKTTLDVGGLGFGAPGLGLVSRPLSGSDHVSMYVQLYLHFTYNYLHSKPSTNT